MGKRLTILIDDKEDQELLHKFVDRGLRITVDVEEKEIIFADEGQTLSVFARAPLEEEE